MDVIVPSESDTELVVETMRDMLETYKLVTVADLYDMLRITKYYRDTLIGWGDLSNVSIIENESGWLISLPDAKPIV